MEGEMILFDTDSFIELMRGNALVAACAREVGMDSVYINPVIKAEIQFKAVDKNDLKRVNARLDAFPVIPFDDDISDRFSNIFERYTLSHRPGVADMLIAATAV